jgi:hypothetical protein
MTAGAWIMMILVCGVTFGGFIGIMALAMSRESGRREDDQ